MKHLFVLALTLFTIQAQAVDTSGCSPLQPQKKTVQTAGNLALTVAVAKGRPGCWNANNATARITYEWLQQNDKEHAVTLWLKVNGSEKTVKADVNCRIQTGDRNQADTSGHQVLKCTAETTVTLGAAQAVSIEIAPQVDGTWDTAGYGQNYSFNF